MTFYSHIVWRKISITDIDCFNQVSTIHQAWSCPNLLGLVDIYNDERGKHFILFLLGCQSLELIEMIANETMLQTKFSSIKNNHVLGCLCGSVS